MPLPGFLTNLFGGKAADIAANITDGLDKLFTSKEEKLEAQLNLEKEINRHFEEVAKMAQTEVDAYLKDTQDARSNNTAIQNSDKASWMAKNIAYVIDIILTVLWSSVTVILFLKIFKIAATEVDMISLMALHGTVTAVFMTVLNFHRGTSKGSEDKSKELKELKSR